MLVELAVLNRDDGVDEIARQLFVGNRLTVFHIDLPKNLVVPVENHAGGFHLFELREIEGAGLDGENADQVPGVNPEPEKAGENDRDRDVVSSAPVPGRAIEVLDRRLRKTGNGHAGRAWKGYKRYNVTKLTTLEPKGRLPL